MPVPIHPDTPMSRCAFCPAAFVAMSDRDTSFIARHEATCPERPNAIMRDASSNWQGPNTVILQFDGSVSTVPYGTSGTATFTGLPP